MVKIVILAAHTEKTKWHDKFGKLITKNTSEWKNCPVQIWITKWWQVLHHWGHAKQSFPVSMERKRSTAKRRDKNERKHNVNRHECQKTGSEQTTFRASVVTADADHTRFRHVLRSVWRLCTLCRHKVSGGNNARAFKQSLPLFMLLSCPDQIVRRAMVNGNSTFSCWKKWRLTATPIKWIGFQNNPKRNTHRARELTSWITEARSPPAWAPKDSRGWVEGEPRAPGHREML